MVPKIPIELWSIHTPSLHHVHISGYPVHLSKGKIEKLESGLEVCVFVGYSKESKGGIENMQAYVIKMYK